MSKRTSLKAEVAKLKRECGRQRKRADAAEREMAARWGIREIEAMVQQLRLGKGLDLHDEAMEAKMRELADEVSDVEKREADPAFRRGWLDCHRGLDLCERCAAANAPPYASAADLIAVNHEIAALDNDRPRRFAVVPQVSEAGEPKQ